MIFIKNPWTPKSNALFTQRSPPNIGTKPQPHESPWSRARLRRWQLLQKLLLERKLLRQPALLRGRLLLPRELHVLWQCHLLPGIGAGASCCGSGCCYTLVAAIGYAVSEGTSCLFG